MPRWGMGRLVVLAPQASALTVWVLLFAGHIVAASQGHWGLFEVMSWTLGLVGLSLGGVAVMMARAFDLDVNHVSVLTQGQLIALPLSASFGWARDGIGIELLLWPSLSLLAWWALRRWLYGVTNG